MNYDDDIRKDLMSSGKLHNTGTRAVDGFDFAEENYVRMEASYSYTAMKDKSKASSCVVESTMSAGRKIRMQSCVVATVSVTVSLGAKPAQADGECLIVHRLDTIALLHICFPCLQICQTHVTVLPTHSRWLKVCQKTELHLTPLSLPLSPPPRSPSLPLHLCDNH